MIAYLTKIVYYYLVIFLTTQPPAKLLKISKNQGEW